MALYRLDIVADSVGLLLMYHALCWTGEIVPDIYRLIVLLVAYYLMGNCPWPKFRDTAGCCRGRELTEQSLEACLLRLQRDIDVQRRP